jgi:diguanylate cyclase (GGDEF)-like protein
VQALIFCGLAFFFAPSRCSSDITQSGKSRGTMKDVLKSDVDAALLHPSPWPFAAPMEACYQAKVGKSRRQRQYCALLVATPTAMLLFAMEAPHTWAIFLHQLAWRGCASVICIAIAFALRRARAPWQEAVLITLASLVVMCLAEILGELAAPLYASGYMFGAIAFVAGFVAFSPVRLGTAIACSIACTLVFPLPMAAFPGNFPLASNLALPAGALLGFSILVLAVRRNEITRRSNFLHGLLHDLVERELQRLNEDLMRLSNTDVLTGLSNRRHFEDEAKRIWNDRESVPFVLAMVDVDRFKALNDSAGHAAGDACLQAVAHALEAALRQDKDRAARYGGEEFVVLMPGAAAGTTAELGERLRLAVENLHMPNPGLEGQSVSVSVGIVRQTGRAGSLEAVLGKADRLLYQAKAAGRNQVSSDAPGGGVIKSALS